MAVKNAKQQVAQAVEVIGTLIPTVGLGWSIVLAVRAGLAAVGRQGFKTVRVTSGSALLLGLEVLVAAGIIRPPRRWRQERWSTRRGRPDPDAPLGLAPDRGRELAGAAASARRAQTGSAKCFVGLDDNRPSRGVTHG
jgi:hypothetical protein